MCGRAPRWQGLFECFCETGRCGHVFDLLMRRTWAAGHNAFRGIGSRPKRRVQRRDGECGFSRSPVSTGLSHYTLSALPNSVGSACLNLQAARNSGSLYAWPLVMMAQIIRAVCWPARPPRSLSCGAPSAAPATVGEYHAVRHSGLLPWLRPPAFLVDIGFPAR